MVQVVSNLSDNILYTVATAKLTAEDYDRFLPIAREKISQYGKLSWYFEMNDFEGWEASALWKDLKFDTQHFNDFKKIAIVGEKRMHEVLANITKPFTSATIKYFDTSEKDEAKHWIKS